MLTAEALCIPLSNRWKGRGADLLHRSREVPQVLPAFVVLAIVRVQDMESRSGCRAVVPSCKTTSHVVQRLVVGCSFRDVEISCWSVYAAGLEIERRWLQITYHSVCNRWMIRPAKTGTAEFRGSVRRSLRLRLLHHWRIRIEYSDNALNYPTVIRTTRPALDSKKGA